MFDDFLKALVGAIIWVVANAVYVDLKRKGLHGFTRFVAFWLGTPTTWIWLFALREGVRPTFTPPPDDEGEALLREIRADRVSRSLPAADEAEKDSNDNEVADVPDRKGDGLVEK